MLIFGIFDEIAYQKCFREKSPGKEYSLKLRLKEKKENKEMIGSSVKDLGSFCQKTLEAIFYKHSRQSV